MEDNAPIHIHHAAKEFWAQYHMEFFNHLAQSPDMNPIEHVWYLLKIRINQCNHIPQSKKELRDALKEEWEKIDADVYQNLMESMPRRMEEVNKAKGGYIKY